MKISHQLLTDFLPDLPNKPDDIAAMLSTKLAEVESVNKVNGDVIYEIENKALTHRPDCFSHWGIAREVSTYYHLEINRPPTETSLTNNEQKRLDIRIKSPHCHRYIGSILRVQVGPSPEWLQQQLASLDIPSVNFVVDITNLIMVKYGQPLHAFDADKLTGGEHLPQIIIRQANPGEVIKTIDGKDRELGPKNLVIADSEKPIAIAGIMGGLESEVTINTERIVLESANFEMYSIRKTSAELGLRTEASTRFEKSLDPNLASVGIQKATELIREHCQGQRIISSTDEYPQPHKPTAITFDPTRVKTFLGLELDEDEIEKNLTALHLEVKKASPAWQITVPTFRTDLKIEEDLLEEVARLHGFNDIPGTLPSRNLHPAELNQTSETRRQLKRFLEGTSYTEVYNYSFTSANLARVFGLEPDRHLALRNPVSSPQNLLRRSLIPQLVRVAAENTKYYDAFNLFEFGKHIYPQGKKLPEEIEHLALLSLIQEPGREQELFYQQKGFLEYCLEKMGVANFRGEPSDETPYLDSSCQITIRQGKSRSLGYLGALSRKIKTHFNIDHTSVVISEINFDALIGLLSTQTDYSPVSPHPVVKQDLSFLVEKTTNLQTLLREIEGAAGDLLRSVEVFDVFFNPEKMPEDKKSVSLHLVFQSDQGTLSHNEVRTVVRQVADMIESKFQGKIRT